MKSKHGFASSSFITIALALICGFSAGAKAEQEEEFISALMARNFEEANRIFEQHFVDPDYQSTSEQSRDYTPLFVASAFQQWHLVARMLGTGAQVNAAPTKGPHQGRTSFAFVLAYRQWPLALRMLELGGDVNVAVQGGPDKGVTPLYSAAHQAGWPFVARVLLTRRNANLEVFPAERPLATFKNLVQAEATPRWVATLFTFLKYRNRDGSSYNAEWSSFHNSVLAFLDFEVLTTICALPREVRFQIAEHAILAQHPELNELPVDLKEHLVRLIKTILRDVHASLDLLSVADAEILRALTSQIVAARVLQKLGPIESRNPNKKTIVRKIRKWILAALPIYLRGRILNKAERDRLVMLLSQTRLSKITRKWIRGQVSTFFEQQDNAPVVMVEESYETKRAREDGDEEFHDLSKLKIRIRRPRVEPVPEPLIREELMLDVIRDAPGLNRDQIDARVDEIMGNGVEPMDVQDNATEADPFEHLRAEFHPAVMQRQSF